MSNSRKCPLQIHLPHSFFFLFTSFITDVCESGSYKIFSKLSITQLFPSQAPLVKKISLGFALILSAINFLTCSIFSLTSTPG